MAENPGNQHELANDESKLAVEEHVTNPAVPAMNRGYLDSGVTGAILIALTVVALLIAVFGLVVFPVLINFP